LLAIHFLGDPLIYFGAPVRGRVIDEATGAPLAGVSIVAEYQLAELIWFGTSAGRRLRVLEATTDAKGEYSFPWWGPVFRPPFAALRDRSPMLTYSKSAHYPIVKMNAHDSDAMIRKSDLDGKVVRLRPFDGDYEKLSNAFSSSDPSMLGCWRECPHYVLALDTEAKRLRDTIPQSVTVFSFPLSLDRMTQANRDYFLKYKK
jgi:hypothetical protein